MFGREFRAAVYKQTLSHRTLSIASLRLRIPRSKALGVGSTERMASTTSSTQRPPSPSQPQSEPYTKPPPQINGDLNNTLAARPTVHLGVDPAYIGRSLAISEADDDPEIRSTYRPFLLGKEVEESDWVSKLELSTAMKMAEKDLKQTGSRLKVLVLYGSLRERHVL